MAQQVASLHTPAGATCCRIAAAVTALTAGAIRHYHGATMVLAQWQAGIQSQLVLACRRRRRQSRADLEEHAQNAGAEHGRRRSKAKESGLLKMLGRGGGQCRCLSRLHEEYIPERDGHIQATGTVFKRRAGAHVVERKQAGRSKGRQHKSGQAACAGEAWRTKFPRGGRTVLVFMGASGREQRPCPCHCCG